MIVAGAVLLALVALLYGFLGALVLQSHIDGRPARPSRLAWLLLAVTFALAVLLLGGAAL